MEIHSRDPGPHFAKVIEKGECLVLDPFHPEVDDARGKSLSAEEIAEGKHPHGDEGDEHVIADGLVVILELRAVNEEAIGVLAHFRFYIY
jgi:hypothetical protein